MSKKIQKRCIICGRTFEIHVLDERPLVDDFFPAPPGQSTSFCNLCEAKIKKEAGDNQKEPKSM